MNEIGAERSGAHLVHGELEAGEHAVEVELLDGQLARAEEAHTVKQVEGNGNGLVHSANSSSRVPLLAHGQVAQEDGRGERERVHVLRARRVHLARAHQRRALRLSLARRLHRTHTMRTRASHLHSLVLSHAPASSTITL